MEELLHRHAGEFDEVFHLLHTVDLLKNGVTYRIEIHQKMAIGYRKQFSARYFKKVPIDADVITSEKGAAVEGVEHTSSGSGVLCWVGVPGIPATADSARESLNQALIWLGIYTKRQAEK